jgi:hypothetical protein
LDTLSLHDALPISRQKKEVTQKLCVKVVTCSVGVSFSTHTHTGYPGTHRGMYMNLMYVHVPEYTCAIFYSTLGSSTCTVDDTKPQV